MLKAPAQATPAPPSTKEKIVDAALQSLKEKGFSGTTARSIAGIGGFNQALIFYYFGSLKELLLAALDETSRRRMEAYSDLVARAETLEDLVASAVQIYREDLDSGHITVLSEMIAGSLASPDLGPQIVARMEPWIDFAQRAIELATKDTPFAQLLPARDLAFAVVAFYLGVEMLNHLDGNRQRAEALFQLSGQAVPFLGSLLGRP